MRFSVALATVPMVLAPWASVVGDDGCDHNVVRALHEQGALVSLSAIQHNLPDEYRGELLDACAERDEEKPSAWHYSIKVLRKDGSVLHLKVDGKTAELHDVEGYSG
ncbi:MAG: PepSY domain-containing protein [Geminicoccaceae bacterium]